MSVSVIEASPSPLPAGAPVSPAADPKPRRSWRDVFFGSSRPDTPPPAEVPAAAEEGRRLRPGDVFGDWEILGHLGSGGMGDVYKAFNRRDHRRHALKVLSPKHRDSPSEVARFELEYLALTRVRHEGIVTPFVAGCEDGVPFYAMELLEGESLERAFTRERLCPLFAARIGAAVAEALSEVHAAAIIHRDIKPGNVFMVKGGGVKLLDLGIAKLLPEFYVDVEMRPPPEARPQTGPGVHLGTTGYMAPETAQGAAAAPAQDIYGLAVTLCRVITGRFPYNAIVPPAPGDEPKLDIEDGRAMPPVLEDVLRRALSVVPSGRQASMSELREELEDAIAEMEKEIAEPVAAPKPRADAPTVIESAAPAMVMAKEPEAVEDPVAPAAAVAKKAASMASVPRRPPLALGLREFAVRGLIFASVFAVFGVGVLKGIRSEREAQSGLRSAVGLARAVTRAATQARVSSPALAAEPINEAHPGPTASSTTSNEINLKADEVIDDGRSPAVALANEGETTAPAKISEAPPRRRALTRAAFSEAIAPHRAALDLCVRDVPGASFLDVEADITATGDLEGIRLSPSTFIATRCVDRILRGVRFPRTQAPSTHRITLGRAEKRK